MKKALIPWAAWYGQEKFLLTFRDSWQVTMAEMEGGMDVGDTGIRKALAQPNGSPPLKKIAQGKKSVAILIDDLTRPTPSYRLLPYVIEELKMAGIKEQQIRIIVALGAHRPLVRSDLIKKIGKELLNRIQVLNHNAYDNLDFLGYSSRGIPIFINRDLMACELKIALGTITPREGFFGGGSKLLIPGACGHVTIMATHRHIADNFREHLDEVARIAGLDFIVNSLVNAELEIMAIVAGEPTEAFHRGVQLGRVLYKTSMPQNVDVGIFNAFPKDTELLQAGMAFVPLESCSKPIFNSDPTLVITSASSEGLGWHTVYGPGTQLAEDYKFVKYRTIVFSPNVTKWDVQSEFGNSVLFYKSWSEVKDKLEQIHSSNCHVAVFPCASLQYGGGYEFKKECL